MTVTATRTKAEQALSRSFEAVAGALPGGAAVAAARKAAIGTFAALGLPHRRMEAWKYTDVRSLMREALPPAARAAVAAPTPAELDAALEGLATLAAHRLVFVDGAFAPALSAPPAALDPGVTFTPLAAALADGEAALVGPPVAQRDADAAVIALNGAFMSDGAVIDIAPRCRLDAPLLLVFASASTEGRLVTTRNRIRIGREARAVVIEAHVALHGAAPAQGNALSEIALAHAAEVDHLKLTLAGTSASHLATWMVELDEAARYRAFQLTAATGLFRNTLIATFAGERAAFDFTGCFLATAAEHVDTTLVVDHARGAGESRELVKGVLGDRARGVFQGKVIVRPDAQKSDGKQMAQALMLSQEAEFDCKPELEIFADDVACGHGATSSEIDADLLFYLRSRGIPAAEARALLIESFIGEAIDKLGSEPLRSAMWTSARPRLAVAAGAPGQGDRQ
jgi:Fe-S cluster assembly protein SufD